MARRGVTTVIERIDPGTLAELIIKATALQEMTNALAAREAVALPDRRDLDLRVDPARRSGSRSAASTTTRRPSRATVDSSGRARRAGGGRGDVVSLDGTTLDGAQIAAARSRAREGRGPEGRTSTVVAERAGRRARATRIASGSSGALPVARGSTGRLGRFVRPGRRHGPDRTGGRTEFVGRVWPTARRLAPCAAYRASAAQIPGGAVRATSAPRGPPTTGPPRSAQATSRKTIAASRSRHLAGRAGRSRGRARAGRPPAGRGRPVRPRRRAARRDRCWSWRTAYPRDAPVSGGRREPLDEEALDLVDRARGPLAGRAFGDLDAARGQRARARRSGSRACRAARRR